MANWRCLSIRLPASISLELYAQTATDGMLDLFEASSYGIFRPITLRCQCLLQVDFSVAQLSRHRSCWQRLIETYSAKVYGMSLLEARGRFSLDSMERFRMDLSGGYKL